MEEEWLIFLHWLFLAMEWPSFQEGFNTFLTVGDGELRDGCN